MVEEQPSVTERQRIVAVSIGTADGGCLIAGSVVA